MRKLFIISLLILAIFSATISEAGYSDWNSTNQLLGTSYMTLVGIDLLQTRSWGEYTHDEPLTVYYQGTEYTLYEANPFVAGSNYGEIVMTALIFNYIGYQIVDTLSPRNRTIALVLLNSIEFAVVKRNNDIIKKFSLVNISF